MVAMKEVGRVRAHKDLTPSQERYREAIVDRLAAGRSPAQIAAELVTGKDRISIRKRSDLKRRIYRLMLDTDMQDRIAKRAQAEVWAEAVSITQAMVKRAKRGRTDASKLAFEISGLHNPRVKHEHSGEITVRLASMPRPELPPADVEGSAEPVDDADVVE